MSTASGATKYTSKIAVMGLKPGMLVQELGWDEDVDEGLRAAILDAIEGEFVYDAVEAVDIVLLWWRDDHGDIVDGLVDALTDLTGRGYIWLLSPKVGRPGYVDPTDLAEGALTAGLSLANTASVAKDWQAHKLVRPKGSRR